MRQFGIIAFKHDNVIFTFRAKFSVLEACLISLHAIVNENISCTNFRKRLIVYCWLYIVINIKHYFSLPKFSCNYNKECKVIRKHLFIWEVSLAWTMSMLILASKPLFLWSYFKDKCHAQRCCLAVSAMSADNNLEYLTVLKSLIGF